MRHSSTRVAVAIAVFAAIALAAVAAGGAVPLLPADDSPDRSDRPDDPTTEGTVGYVEGYWYDDELAVDDRDDAVVEDDELEAVVYRSMARVEKIRGMTFEGEVPVEVISREEFRSGDGAFVDRNESQQRARNVTYEALFMVDTEANATAELQSMYGGSVEGYYEPSADRIVIVSDTPEQPELNEIVLGHELTHALQDQRFDLTNYDRSTIDGTAAENGLIEGDAVTVETEYERRCEANWDCLSADGSSGPPPSNWGIYLTLFQPYDDGPAYVDHLRESGEGWTAVDERYDDPPASSSTVIHREDREPVDVTVEDRSNESWRPLEVGDEVATETVGEAGMVAMFADGAFERSRSSVLEIEEFLGDDATSYDYDQPQTDGWAGDELVPYVSADADGNASSAETGYVWETEWRSADHAREFASAYLELLEIHGADPVDGRQDTYRIDGEGYPGAYSLERDGETVTIVHAPSVDDLEGISATAAPEGEDAIEPVDVADSAEGDGEGADGGAQEDDSVPGFAVPGTGAAVATALLAARARARRTGSDSGDGSDSSAPVTADSPRSVPTGPDAGLEGPGDDRSDRGRA